MLYEVLQIKDKNVDLHKRMKNKRNDKYVGIFHF